MQDYLYEVYLSLRYSLSGKELHKFKPFLEEKFGFDTSLTTFSQVSSYLLPSSVTMAIRATFYDITCRYKYCIVYFGRDDTVNDKSYAREKLRGFHRFSINQESFLYECFK